VRFVEEDQFSHGLSIRRLMLGNVVSAMEVVVPAMPEKEPLLEPSSDKLGEPGVAIVGGGGVVAKVLGLGSAPLVYKSAFEDMMPSNLCLSLSNVGYGRINRNRVEGVAVDQSMHRIEVQLLKRGGCVHAC
jgi:hypothetical protein